jgi:nucleoside-diphosphate-sugar epimerase
LRLLVFGYGYSAQALGRRLTPQGWDIAATVRDGAAALSGVDAVPLDPASMAAALAQADALLVTAPPGPEGCPALAVLGPALARTRPRWIGYLSTTGVYGDRRGGWVSERSPLAAQSVEGARRVRAEQDWREAAGAIAFRLPGIYGPGRSALDRLAAGQARRIAAPGQVFSRIHVDDLAAGLEASLARPRPGAAYNLCDDAPASNSDVIAYAARLLGREPPPEVPLAEANLSPAAQRFYAESKRVSNALAKAELGWRPRYPTYREGLQAILAAEQP